MAKREEREKAISQRKKGMSYSQIKKRIKVSSSTLSYWLKDYPLSEERIKKLQHGKQRIEKFRETMRKKKLERLEKTYKKERDKIFPINKRDLYIAGLFLYWGEGTKSGESRLTLANSDPSLIKFFLHWATRVMEASKEKIRIYLHLYKDMNVEKEMDFWAKELKIPLSQFGKPYIKDSEFSRINHKGGFNHGTCSATISGTRMKERVMMAIKSVREDYKGT